MHTIGALERHKNGEARRKRKNKPRKQNQYSELFTHCNHAELQDDCRIHETAARQHQARTEQAEARRSQCISKTAVRDWQAAAHLTKGVTHRVNVRTK